MLTVEPGLREVLGFDVLGLAGAAVGERGAVVLVTAAPVQVPDDARAGLMSALGVAELELVELSGADLVARLRQWVHQAATGAGRGVAVRVSDGERVLVEVSSLDSSARELCLRLASPWEPALPALEALLGRPVDVRESAT